MRYRLLILILLIVLGSNGYSQKVETPVNNDVKIQSKGYFYVYDPLEKLNKKVYYFNYQFDKYIFYPTIEAYEFITPKFVQKGVSNFWKNVKNINTTTNSLLQLKVKKSMRSTGRFIINTTFGLGGLFDVASKLGMPKPYEDFGLTLAHYGVGEGPYLVLPLLGPSNFRDGIGSAVDLLSTGEIFDYSNLGELNSIPATILYGVDKRKSVDFRYYQSLSPFEYEYVRFIYTKFRRVQSEYQF